MLRDPPWGECHRAILNEGSLASTVQAGDLLRIAAAILIPRVMLVGDRKQLDTGGGFGDGGG